MKIAKKSKKLSIPFCQTIKVVISPKGENAPPALAATTILTHPIEINLLLSFPTAKRTAHKTNAVVRLSAMGDKKKAITPVITNNCLYVKPLLVSQDLNALKTSLLSNELI